MRYRIGVSICTFTFFPESLHLSKQKVKMSGKDEKTSNDHRKKQSSSIKNINSKSVEMIQMESMGIDSQSEDEELWIDEIEHGSISPEGSSEEIACARYITTSHQQPWTSNQIVTALGNLPEGEIIQNLMPTLRGEVLDNILKDFKERNISGSTIRNTKFELDKLKNGGVKKTSITAHYEAGLRSSPAFLLEMYPETWLLVACWLGHYEIVKVLLEEGVNISARDGDGRTPLHLAACAGRSGIVDELLKHGANPNEWDTSRELTPIHCAASLNDVCSIKLLIKQGGDVNIGLPGRTPLHYAVLSNACDCVEVLLKSGAIPNNPQVYTETPLHVAASLGCVKSVELLLNYGADARVQFGTARSTPLHLAAEEGSSACTKLLLQAGAPCDARNAREQTAMHLAALAQSAETLEVLIAFGADINAEDDGGRTPLHTAVAKTIRGSDLIRILLQAGSQINKPDKFGYTPLHIAALNESSYVVNLLLSKGADVTARTKGGVSALSFIIRRTPDVLPRFISRMDQGISLHDHELGDVDCELRLDFRALVPGGRGETDLMLCLVEVGQKHIMKHPLCESFLYLKWLRIRKFFLFSLIFHSIFVAVYTSYIAVSYIYDLHGIAIILFWPVLIFTLVVTCKELFQLAHGICIYAKSWENWLQWGVIVTTTVVLIRPYATWEYHIAAIGILLNWTELMMVVGRFPMFGLYVQMFTQVAVNFFKFIGAYLCLIVGFSLAFSLLHHNYKSFHNPLVGLLKTIVMMSGELEFEDVFFDENDKLLYPVTAHLMLLAFVILVTVILTNLMVGLAVSDIQELRRCAGMDRLVRRAELVAHLENMLFSKLLDHGPRKLIRACRREALLLHPPHHCAIHIRPNDPREKRLPKELIKAVYTLVSEKKIHRGKKVNQSIKDRDNTSVDGFDRCKLRRFYSITSNSDNGRVQLKELANDLRKCSQNISIRLEMLISKVEATARENDAHNDL